MNQKKDYNEGKKEMGAVKVKLAGLDDLITLLICQPKEQDFPVQENQKEGARY